MNDSQPPESVLESKEKRKNSNKLIYFQIAASIVGVTTAIITIMGVLGSLIPINWDIKAQSLKSTSLYQIDRINKELSAQQTIITELNANLDAIMKLPEGSEIAVQIAA